MISVQNLELRFSDKLLFENITTKFTKGNCYGVIGANGAGKSTFLKILSKEIDSTKGNIIIEKGMRMSFLKQDHFEFDEYSVLDTVIMGHSELYSIMVEKDALYAKEDFTEADGIKSGNLEARFAELDGWSSEYNAEVLLDGLGVKKELHQLKMADIKGGDKVKVLLAQALFGNPDILLLDEPTNHLDFQAIVWLENFLMDFDQTVVVVSHDRHFLNKICTHMFDIDRRTGKLYVGNYDFWRQSSELALKLQNDANKKKEEKIKELEAFIARFSANASKSSQATSRKKTLDKINVENIEASSRRYPFIGFDMERTIGKQFLEVSNLSKSVNGKMLFENVSFKMLPNQKAVFLGVDDSAKSMLFSILAGEDTPDSGEVKWGSTVSTNYLPDDNSMYFQDPKESLVDWLRKYSKDPAESYLRSFLGRMLFSGQQPLKKVKVLSGGEKMRCMFSKLMLSNSNTLILDQPTNHLDLESIQSVNDGIIRFKGSVLFTSHDKEFIQTIADKVITIGRHGAVSYDGDLREFLNNESLQEKVKELD